MVAIFMTSGCGRRDKHEYLTIIATDERVWVASKKINIEARGWEGVVSELNIKGKDGELLIVMVFNHLGAEGWELVSVSDAPRPSASGQLMLGTTKRYFFKRGR